MAIAMILKSLLVTLLVGVLYFIYRFVYVQRKVIKFYAD